MTTFRTLFLRHIRLPAAALAVLAGAGLAATPASAGIEPQPFRLLSSLEDPRVLFGFNPQPEPPPAALVSILTTTPASATLTVRGASNPQDFRLFFAISAVNIAATTVPPEPIAPRTDYGHLAFDVDTGTQLLTVVLDFTTSSGGMVDASTDIVGFNPQPEPPPSALGGWESFEMNFQFTSLSDASVTMTIFDAAGNQLRLEEIAESAALGLFGLGLAGLGLAARQRG